MKTIFSKVGALLLTLGLVSILASAFDFGPGGHRGRNQGGPTSVAEPAAIALLAAGLVSLGFYAKKRHDKKK